MARTTNSDTLPYVDSRYELVELAGQRVRDLEGGAEAVIETKKDKPTVTALKEIATGQLDMDKLRHEFIQSYKENSNLEEGEINIETTSIDPLLKEIDAELDNALMDEPSEEEAVQEIESED